MPSSVPQTDEDQCGNDNTTDHADDCHDQEKDVQPIDGLVMFLERQWTNRGECWPNASTVENLNGLNVSEV